MARPNFFCGIDALNCILGMEFGGDYRDIELTMDLIELPYYLHFSADVENWTVKVMQRGEICTHHDSGLERGSVVLNKKSGKGQAKVSPEVGENMLCGFLTVCRNISKYIQDKDLESVYANFDSEETGIMLYVEGEELKYKVVEGTKRPDMMVMTLFHGPTMGRPYIDEIMMRDMMSNMSIEEKISAAEGGDSVCMESLAMAYTNGDDVEQDFEKAFYWWKKLADTGNANGQFNTGLHYSKGCGVKRDFAKAAEWMNKAAENGDEDAPYAAKAYGEASVNLKKAKAGDAVAQAALAGFYMQIGGSLEQFGAGNDYSESFMWAKKAADQGNLDGMYCLGLCYEHARGTDFAPTKAAMTYQKAAELGHAPSQWNLAVCYLNGQGYEQNETKGLSWAYESAAQGYDLAIQYLERQCKTIPQIIERFSNDEIGVSLEGTQYEGRADRCERIRAGMELTYKIVKDKNGDDALECFYSGGSVGLLSDWVVNDVIVLLNLDRISLTIKVKSCIPKSKRGARARNADVHLDLIIKEKRQEMPEERAALLETARLATEKAEAERKRKEKEKRKAEEKRRKAKAEAKAKREEEKRKYNEAYKKWEAEADTIKAKRSAYVEDKIAAEKASLKADAAFKRDAAVSKANAELKEQMDRKAIAETTLASLGMFKFGEKKNQKAIIDDATKRIADAQLAISVAESTYKSETSEVEKKTDNKAITFRNEAVKAYPMPEKPKKHV